MWEEKEARAKNVEGDGGVGALSGEGEFRSQGKNQYIYV